MKIIIYIVVSLFVILDAAAKPINSSKAETIAAGVVKKMHRDPIMLQPSNLQNEAKNRFENSLTSPTFYAFNIQDDKGFVIVSGDDEFPQILGYSDSGNLPSSYDQLPCCMRAFLESYSQYVEAVREGKADAPNKAHGESTGTPCMDLLITAKWDQEEPYNLYCPSDDTHGQSYVGCVATAMAQIMYKWKWPLTGKGSVSYTNAYGNTWVDFSQSNYNWSVMKNTYGRLDSKKESGKAVAKLSFDCGVSVYMKYSSTGSGTYTQYVLQSLYKNFSYKASTLEMVRRECCNDTREFRNTIIRELRQGRPVLFSAVSSKGSGRDASGHAFVIDGYDTEDFLHVNWGWSGSSNGYYDVDVMDASQYEFNQEQDVVIGIEPDYDGTDITPNQYRLYFQNPPSVSIQNVALSTDFNVNVGAFYNMFPFGNAYFFGVALYNFNGEFQQVVSETPRQYLSAWTGYSEYGTLKCNIPNKYDNKGYLLRFVSRQENYDEWKLVDLTGGSELNKIPIVIKNGTVYFNEYPTAINDLTTDANVMRTEFYNLNGQLVRDIDNAPGIIIEKRVYSDGSIKTMKRFVR